VGLLKEELRRSGSLILACADATGVRREGPWRGPPRLLQGGHRADPTHPLSPWRRELDADPDRGLVIVAYAPDLRGPHAEIGGCCPEPLLNFYDAPAHCHL
jgi:methylenetetrahydrofolate--tRNA-(uracil-5-)-methyltransferase